MPYPHCMQDSLAKLNSTREQRLQSLHPELTFEDKTALLQKFHPDFNPAVKRPLRVGCNRGVQVAQEVANLLESPARILHCIYGKQLNVSKAHFTTDVLIIGSGGAGLAAALWLKKNTHLNVMVSTKLRTLDSNTVMAEGGISAATAAKDSAAIHFVDTMVGGRFHNDPELVQTMVSQGSIIIDWLASLGVYFDTHKDGEFFTHRPGGHSRMRSHSIQDITGLEIMRCLQDEARYRNVHVKEFCPAVELILDDAGACVGAVLQNLDTKQYYVVHAKAVIMASGGMGRLHPLRFPTSNFYGATADGLVLGYRAGAQLVHMDSIQYHPTGTVWPNHLLGLLISEAVRAQGAQLINSQGEMFIGNLETRDALASAIIQESFGQEKHVLTPTGNRGVWLDTVLIDKLHGEGTFKRRFGSIYHRFMACDINPALEPILVYPTQHYQNGGLAIDSKARTTVPYLYAAGEVSGGIHGKNRLGGNALLDIFVYGHVAAEQAAEDILAHKRGNSATYSLRHVSRYEEELYAHGIAKESFAPMLFPEYRFDKAFTL